MTSVAAVFVTVKCSVLWFLLDHILGRHICMLQYIVVQVLLVPEREGYSFLIEVSVDFIIAYTLILIQLMRAF